MPIAAPLRLAVFDMDGTLIDSQVVILEAMSRGFEAAGLAPPPAEATLSIVGLSLPEAVARLAPELPPQEVLRVADLYKQAFVAVRAETGGEAAAPLYPGARRALDRLGARETLLMGVATGKSRRGVDHALDVHALHGLFHTVQTADDHPSKPHPSMLARAAEESGVDPACAVMIGDTEFDMEMARAAGFAALAVTWGYHPEDRLRRAGAQVVIHDYGELEAALDALWEPA